MTFQPLLELNYYFHDPKLLNLISKIESRVKYINVLYSEHNVILT